MSDVWRTCHILSLNGVLDVISFKKHSHFATPLLIFLDLLIHFSVMNLDSLVPLALPLYFYILLQVISSLKVENMTMNKTLQ